MIERPRAPVPEREGVCRVCRLPWREERRGKRRNTGNERVENKKKISTVSTKDKKSFPGGEWRGGRRRAPGESWSRIGCCCERWVVVSRGCACVVVRRCLQAGLFFSSLRQPLLTKQMQGVQGAARVAKLARGLSIRIGLELGGVCRRGSVSGGLGRGAGSLWVELLGCDCEHWLDTALVYMYRIHRH